MAGEWFNLEQDFVIERFLDGFPVVSLKSVSGVNSQIDDASEVL